MSIVPPTDSLNPDAMLHVSLTGNKVKPRPAADQASQNSPDSGSESKASPPEQLGKLFEIIGAIASAGTRVDAMRILTQEISRRFPDATVRCGIGNAQLKRLYDQRLGWLGPESGPRIAAAQQWTELVDAECGVLINDQAMILCMPQTDSDQRCLLWIYPVANKSVFGEWLRTIIRTLSNVFWSRPKYAAPKAIRNVTRRTLTIVGGLMLVGLLSAFWPVHYRVACTARVQPIQQRLVATPFEATLLSNHVKPGETVKAGQLLVTLDGRPLRLERESILAEIQQASKEHDTALATGRIADAQQARLRERQLNRTLQLLSDRLQRLEVVSPIDGVIISGDLSQYIGSPLELGQTMFEISPMDQMAIEIEIPAHEIDFVSAHSPTRIRFGSIGGRSIQQELDDLYPSSVIRDDKNVFIGRVEVENTNGKLRPGMQGDATTYGPLRPWIWSWIRGGFERVLWWVGY
ncbi:GAF domain-containing protein [Rhodopirellula maiorica SM1]|uniref:GAF domain-containing protein n=1 Tax=Rhodopirellula maiorica SM1 TaxID=1265738 RepID=M5R829_9BACT|nr:efflux RND transporter periplasmic adaptor subunit [Rhodopirellula maiorica]EMI15638.1 GAF domain-containing protein [Rhodopirellula maiorica SM1]